MARVHWRQVAMDRGNAVDKLATNFGQPTACESFAFCDVFVAGGYVRRDSGPLLAQEVTIDRTTRLRQLFGIS
jgi:hypothetical protein